MGSHLTLPHTLSLSFKKKKKKTEWGGCQFASIFYLDEKKADALRNKSTSISLQFSVLYYD